MKLPGSVLTNPNFDKQEQGKRIAEWAKATAEKNNQEIIEISEQVDQLKEEIQALEDGKSKRSGFELAKGWSFTILGLSLCFAVIISIFMSLLPIFYEQVMLAGFLACCAGTVVPATVEIALEKVKNALQPRDLTLVVIVIALSASVMGISAGVNFSNARTLIMEAQAVSSQDIPAEQTNDSQPGSLLRLKKAISGFSMTGTILLTLCIEMGAGLIIFIGLGKIRRYRPIALMQKQLRLLRTSKAELKAEVAFLAKITPEFIERELGFQKLRADSTKSKLVLVTAIIVIGAILGLAIFLPGYVSAAEPPINYVISIDCTGYGNAEEHELNKKAVLGIINQMQPRDTITISLITEHEAPQVILVGSIPQKKGFFNEYLIAARKKLARTFLKRIKDVNTKRPSTALLGCLYYLAKMCQELKGKTVLVIYSDMQPYSDIKVNDVYINGRKILAQLKRQELIPSMKGISVYCMGVSPHSVTRQQYKALESFWREYFKLSGATLKRYSIGRHPVSD